MRNLHYSKFLLFLSDTKDKYLLISVFLLLFHIGNIRKVQHDSKVILIKQPYFSSTYLGRSVLGSACVIAGVLQSKYNHHLLLLMQKPNTTALHIWNMTVLKLDGETLKASSTLVCISTLGLLEESAGSKNNVKFLLIRCYCHSQMMQEGKANVSRNRAILLNWQQEVYLRLICLLLRSNFLSF